MRIRSPRLRIFYQSASGLDVRPNENSHAAKIGVYEQS